MFKNSVFNANVNTKEWLINAGIRAVKTMAQTGIALIPVAVTITEIDWPTIAGTMVTAGIMSILTSLAGIPEVEAEEE